MKFYKEEIFTEVEKKDDIDSISFSSVCEKYGLSGQNEREERKLVNVE